MRKEKDKERGRRKEQKRRQGTKYGQTKRKQARRGVVSCSIAAVSYTHLVDTLAIAIGTCHGLYPAGMKPELNWTF